MLVTEVYNRANNLIITTEEENNKYYTHMMNPLQKSYP